MTIDWRDHIEERKGVMMGQAGLQGDPVDRRAILNEMGAGMTEEELLENYPTLRPEHIRAARRACAARR